MFIVLTLFILLINYLIIEEKLIIVCDIKVKKQQIKYK